MEKDEVVMIERFGSGYKVRMGTKKEVSANNIASILVVIAGAIGAYIWYLLWM